MLIGQDIILLKKILPLLSTEKRAYVKGVIDAFLYAQESEIERQNNGAADNDPKKTPRENKVIL